MDRRAFLRLGAGTPALAGLSGLGLGLPAMAAAPAPDAAPAGLDGAPTRSSPRSRCPRRPRRPASGCLQRAASSATTSARWQRAGRPRRDRRVSHWRRDTMCAWSWWAGRRPPTSRCAPRSPVVALRDRAVDLGRRPRPPCRAVGRRPARIPAADPAAAPRRHRARHRAAGHSRRRRRRGQGPRALPMGGRPYLPRCQRARLRHRRRGGHAAHRGIMNGKCADINALFVALSRAVGIRRATPTACASTCRSTASRPGRTAIFRRPSIAAPSSTRPATAGCRSIPPTCARSRWKKRRVACRWTTPRCARAPAVRRLGDELGGLQPWARRGIAGQRRAAGTLPDVSERAHGGRHARQASIRTPSATASARGARLTPAPDPRTRHAPPCTAMHRRAPARTAGARPRRHRPRAAGIAR